MRDALVRKMVASLRRAWGSTGLLLAAVALMAGGFLLAVPWSAVAAWGVDLLRGWGSAGPVTLAGAVLLLVAVSPRMVTRVRSGDRAASRQASVRPIPMWGIWLGAVVVVLVGVLAAAVLMVIFGSGTAEDKIRLEAIKLAGTIALGTGGGAALLLTARRQRTTEVDLLQKGHDADERRITELYTAAAQQLASDKAPVRMAGLYALERLGQSSPEHQQTIVNLFCAYLRMPDTSAPTDEAAAPGSEAEAGTEWRQEDARQPLLLDLAPTLAEAAGLSLDAVEQQQQEREVRLTVQGLLAQHLRPEPDQHGRPTNPNFWGGQDGTGLALDLSNATLRNLDFARICVRDAYFIGACFREFTSFKDAQFYGTASFRQASFSGSVNFESVQFRSGAAFFWADLRGFSRFDGAQFDRLAAFSGAQFQDHARFEDAQFYGGAWFDEGAKFYDYSQFERANFCGISRFAGVEFHDDARFKGATFNANALFGEAQFHGSAWFEGVQFHDSAWFEGAGFHDRAWFKGARFHDEANFVETQFHDGAMFGEVELHQGVAFGGAWMRLDTRLPPVAAPRGWKLRPVDPGDGRAGQWGELVPAVGAAEGSEGRASSSAAEQ